MAQFIHNLDVEELKCYTMIKLLGKGSFGTCYEVISNTGRRSAMKFISKASIKTKEQIGSMNSEILIHKSLKHRNIVNFYMHIDTPDNLVILMELCSNNSLKLLLRRRTTITEPETRYYTRQIALACKYMHSKKVIHRDLKTDNIFLDDRMEIKVADFGLSVKCVDAEKVKSECGTPLYMAPEIRACTGYSYPVDLWALGCIAYVMLIGDYPFLSPTREELTNNVRLNLYSIPLSINDYAVEVIHKLLSDIAEDRPTVDELLAMNFYKGFIPETLPLSALVSAPRFPDNNSEQKSYQTIRNTLVTDTIQSHGETTKKHLTKLQRNIEELLSKSCILEHNSDSSSTYLMTDSECPSMSPVFWITKWTITNKYGLGYKLNDDSTGVVLNSGTKLVLIGDNNKIQCIDDEENELFCSMDNFPENLATDIHVLKLFQKHLNNNLAVTGMDMITHDTEEMAHLPYVDAYVRSKKSLLLFLSSGVMQMNVLSDHTKLILCPVMGAVSYVDSEFRTYSMEKLQKYGITQQMHDRLRYALDIIESVLELDNINGDMSCLLDCQ